MPAAFLTRLARLHSRLAPAVLLVPSLVYLASWNIEPYLYGFSVLGLAPVQLAWLLAGLVFAALRVPQARSLATLLVSTGAAASAVVAFAFLKSINWA